VVIEHLGARRPNTACAGLITFSFYSPFALATQVGDTKRYRRSHKEETEGVTKKRQRASLAETEGATKKRLKEPQRRDRRGHKEETEGVTGRDTKKR
jgi:hypothetical protein